MPLSYHWNAHHLHVVCQGRVHMLACDDARYPWVLRALSISEQAVASVLSGDMPASWDAGGQYRLFALNVDQNPSDIHAWEEVDVVDNGGQACLAACDYMLQFPQVSHVRVQSMDGDTIYALARSIELATS